MKKNILLFAVSAIMSLTATTQAQIETPRPSPLSSINQKVGLIDVNIVYSRPSAKGRTIMGDVVAYEKLWRTGANASTKIKISGDAAISGNKMEAGEYALFTVPGKDEWTVIIHKNLKAGVGNYNADDDLFRIKVKPTKLTEKVESFTISFDNIKDNMVDISLVWENTKVSFTLTTDFDAQVMKKISDVMAGPSANDYYAAASYYHDNKKDIKQAVSWVNKAVELSPDKYWVVRKQALILFDAGMKKEAIAAAQKSLELSEKAGNDEYVKMNKESIAAWSKK
jgi:hypothetical protein